MQKLLLCLTVLCALSVAAQVWAFSTEQAPVQQDGSAKFNDPDDQMPGFMVAPSMQGNGAVVPLMQNGAQVTQPSLGDVDNGSAAFDRAYNHLQTR